MRRQAIPVRGFKGLWSSIWAPANFCRHGKNFLCSPEGNLEVIWGSRKAQIQPSVTGQVRNIFNLDGEIMLTDDSSVKRFIGSGWISVSTAGFVQSDMLSKNHVSAARFLGNSYLACGLALLRFNRITNTLSDVDAENYSFYTGLGGVLENYVSIKGVHPTVHASRLWLGLANNIVAYTDGFTDKFYTEDPDSGLPVLNFIQVGGDSTNVSSVEDQITCVVAAWDRLFIFKRRSVHEIVGRLENEFQDAQISNVYGTDSGASVRVTPAGIFFLDTNTKAVVRLDGQGFTPVSGLRSEEFIQVNYVKPSNVKSCVFAGRYYILNMGASTLVYDFQYDHFGVDDSQFTAMCQNPNNTGIYAFKEDSAYLWDVGETGARWAEADGTGGEAIDFEVYLGYSDLGSPANDKTLFEAKATIMSPEHSFQMDFQIDERYLPGVIGTQNPFPRGGEFFGGRSRGNISQGKVVIFHAPMDATGKMHSVVVKKSTRHRFTLSEVVLYFLTNKLSSEEGE